MMEWTEHFATGLPAIDAQHRTLIDNLNRLEPLLTTTNPTREECEFIINLVAYLESYTKTHFRFEEQCMERHRCPAHQKNKEAHENFLRIFQRFQEQYTQEGFRPELLKSLHDTATHWIRDHILHIDVQLRPCLEESAAPTSK